MQVALQEENSTPAVQDVLSGLRRSIASELRSSIQGAQALGLDEAERQLSYYKAEIQKPINALMSLASQADSANYAVLARLDAQIATVNAMVLTGEDEDLIVGDENRVGILAPSPITAAIAFWLAALTWDALWWLVQNHSKGPVFKKQAIAALDHKTTNCCLMVHGQVQNINDPFKLDGTPRYADELDSPPFHGHCRTAIALYQEEFDEGLTDEMISAAEAILAERAGRVFKIRHPADAFG
jgi:hypothetical protein